MVSKKKEIDEKWKARSDRLSMCECSLGTREPGGGGMAPRGGFSLPAAGREPPTAQSSGAKGLGGPQKDPA